jgi:hypothetical protein
VEFRNLTPNDKTNLQEQKQKQDDGEASLALRATRNRNAGRGRAERQPGIARRRGIGPERRARARASVTIDTGFRRFSVCGSCSVNAARTLAVSPAKSGATGIASVLTIDTSGGC